MKAKLVIRIGRSRERGGVHGGVEPVHALVAPPAGELDDEDGVLGGKRDQHDQADLREDVVVHARAGHTPLMRARTHIGTIRMTASGSVQLSYCAASTRKTNSTAIGEESGAVLPDRLLLEGEAGPFEAEAGRQVSRGDLLHRPQCFARARRPARVWP